MTLRCKLFGHEWYVLERLGENDMTKSTVKIHCPRCNSVEKHVHHWGSHPDN